MMNTALLLASSIFLLTSCLHGGNATVYAENGSCTEVSATERAATKEKETDRRPARRQEATDALLLQKIANAETPSQILVRKGYVTSYNKDTKCPNWVAWHLTAEHSDGDIPRPSNAFHEDDDVPEPRVQWYDYKGSGYTRGHMCPAGDNNGTKRPCGKPSS